jgi:hypothetical protein
MRSGTHGQDWPLLVVFRDSLFSDLTHLLEIVEQMRIERFQAVRTVEAFDEGVLIGGLLGSMKHRSIFYALHHSVNSSPDCSIKTVIIGCPSFRFKTHRQSSRSRADGDFWVPHYWELLAAR